LKFLIFISDTEFYCTVVSGPQEGWAVVAAMAKEKGVTKVGLNDYFPFVLY